MPILTTGARIDREPSWAGEYHPLKEPELFRRFAETRATEKGVSDFVAKWGLMGWQDSQAVIGDEAANPPHLVWVEPLVRWLHAIWEMQWAVELRDSLESEDAEAVRAKYDVQFQRGAWVYLPSCAFGHVDPATVSFPSAFDPINDRVLAGRLVLQSRVNDRLRESARPRLVWDEERGRHEPRILPENLHGALWWQFARTLMGDVSYRPCKECGRPIEISVEETGFRRDREFCSGACRQKDHREKVKRAVRMHAEGRSVREIALQLGSEPEAVQNWLKKDSRAPESKKGRADR